MCHLGVDSTLNQLRGCYWIIKGRQTVKSLLRQCICCRKVQGKVLGTPPTNDLPRFRVKCEYAFENVGLDFAGPLYTKDIYSSGGMYKCYVLLFTCATTRCLHLELTPNQGVDSLLLAMKRFMSRRGRPRLYVSDNFSSFKAATITDFMSINGIEWSFILEKAPWWGGFYERCVKIVKDSLKKVVGTARLNFDEMRSVLCEVENAANTRPLTYLSHENHEQALTPYHLVYGRNINLVQHNQGLLSDPDRDNMSSRVRHIRTVIGHYMNRFQNEYITNLREFHRRRNPGDVVDLTVGDLVLMKEATPRMMWRKALVTGLIRGTDGIVRGVDLRIRSKNNDAITTLRRPIQHLVPLELKRDIAAKDAPVELRPKRVAAVTGELVRRLTKF